MCMRYERFETVLDEPHQQPQWTLAISESGPWAWPNYSRLRGCTMICQLSELWDNHVIKLFVKNFFNPTNQSSWEIGMKIQNWIIRVQENSTIFLNFGKKSWVAAIQPVTRLWVELLRPRKSIIHLASDQHYSCAVECTCRQPHRLLPEPQPWYIRDTTKWISYHLKKVTNSTYAI